MKEFWVYTVLRIGLFIACLAVAAGLWLLAFGRDGVLVWPLLVAVIASSLLSLRLLAGPREQFAQVVGRRADRAVARFEDIRASDDVD